MRGGEGSVTVVGLISKEELLNKGRLFANLVIEPGSSIGYHVHEADCEIFYIKKGTAVYNDNGLENIILSEGDVAITPAGSGHAVRNDSQGILEIIALILE